MLAIAYAVTGGAYDFFAFDAAGLVYNGSAWVAWADGDFADYRIPAAESGDSGRFVATLPDDTARYSMRASGADLAASYLVWEEAVGAGGGGSLTPEQATWLEETHAKAMLIGSSEGAFISRPVTRSGIINPLVAGDDYLAENNRTLSWSIPVSKNGPAASVIFKAVSAEDSSIVIGPVEGVVSGEDESQIAAVELPSDETDVTPGTYRWDLQIQSLTGKKATPWYGELKVIGDVAD